MELKIIGESILDYVNDMLALNEEEDEGVVHANDNTMVAV